MANTNAPFGFKHIGYIDGGAPQHATSWTKISSSYATAIFSGDPILRVSTGYAQRWVNGQTATLLMGIFVGCKYLSTSRGAVTYNNYYPGSDAATDVDCEYIPCELNTTPLFVVQGTANAAGRGYIGSNADVTMTAGSTATGISAASLAIPGSIATTATFPFRIHDLWNGFGSYAGATLGTDATSVNNWLIVRPNTFGTTGV